MCHRILRELNTLKTREHPYIEQAAMTDVTDESTPAGSVLRNIKQVWYVAVVEIAGGISLRSFGDTFSKSATQY